MSDTAATLQALLREYPLVCRVRACAESLAGANASRLPAMPCADRNSNELLENRRGAFHRLRESGIDEEPFDVISGYEAMSGPLRRTKGLK